MQAIKLKGMVDENRKLSLTLPPGTKTGAVEVVVLFGEDTKGQSANNVLAELLQFHKGRRLDGISLSELVNEGRR